MLECFGKCRQCCTNTRVSMTTVPHCPCLLCPQGLSQGLQVELYPGLLPNDLFSPVSTGAGALLSAGCLVAWCVPRTRQGPCPALLPAITSDPVPGGMCVPALGPAPVPEVTPTGSHLVPVFPVHEAPWLVSSCTHQPPTCAWHSWKAPSRRPPQDPRAGRDASVSSHDYSLAGLLELLTACHLTEEMALGWGQEVGAHHAPKGAQEAHSACLPPRPALDLGRWAAEA